MVPLRPRNGGALYKGHRRQIQHEHKSSRSQEILVMEMSAATMQRLALLDATFYSIGVFSPTLTIGTPCGLIFHMSDAACYATLRASDPNPRLTLALVFFVATLPSLGPSWR
jgi:hypothetical protein